MGSLQKGSVETCSNGPTSVAAESFRGLRRLGLRRLRVGSRILGVFQGFGVQSRGWKRGRVLENWDWSQYDLSAEPSKSWAGIPRAPGGGTHRAGQAAFGNQAPSPIAPKCWLWLRDQEGSGRFVCFVFPWCTKSELLSASARIWSYTSPAELSDKLFRT